MLQAFRLDCLATKMLISGRWLTQIEHFRLLVLETMDLMLASPFVKLQIIFPMILPGPCCGLCRLSLCTLRLQAFGPQASEVPAKELKSEKHCQEDPMCFFFSGKKIPWENLT